jgi:lactose/L-arabinose transport system ATP-binding protein
MASVELEQVRKTFGNIHVIHGVDLTIDHGEFTVFVGPSGCGKSTLLRMIAGLEDLSGGELRIGGDRMNEVEASERGVAMVFQSYALYPHMTVEENMGFGLRMTGHPRDQIRTRVREASEVLQLEPLMKRKPSQLSGGQRQRVAIGRAIVRNPKVFLFDEPLSNLDAELRVAMRVEIAKLHQRLGNTMVYVTHDQTEAMTLADKIVVLRAGKVEQAGSPLKLYEDPDNLFVAGFIGSPKMNFFPAVTIDADGRSARLGDVDVALPLATSRLTAGTALQIGIRPEHFDRVADPDVRLPVDVDVVEHLGGTSYLYGRLPSGDPIVVERRDGEPVRAGSRIEVGFQSADLRAFTAEGARLR